MTWTLLASHTLVFLLAFAAGGRWGYRRAVRLVIDTLKQHRTARENFARTLVEAMATPPAEEHGRPAWMVVPKGDA